MKIIGLFIITLLTYACQSSPDYRPEFYLDPIEKDEMLQKIIRYAGKLPQKVSDSLKFNNKHDAYYRELASKHQFTHYYISDNGEHFFMIKRPAPSLHEKYAATGGRMRFNETDSLIEYEEVFRTWKMIPDTLLRRGALLFDKMVTGKSLEPYLTKNSGGIEFIEFPDEHVTYDKESRLWKSKQFGSIEEMVKTDVDYSKFK